MAQNQTYNKEGWVDKRLAAVPGGVQTSNPWSGGTSTNTKDITAMRTRLAAISATYTATYLDKMTYNDMLWAIRQNDEAAGI